MDIEELKEQLGENKKKLYLLGAVLVFGIYMLWPSGSAPTEEDNALDDELAALQASRGDVPAAGPQPRFSGTDQRNISLGGGGGGDADPTAFETESPVVRGTFLGYGVKSDTSGQYLNAYLSDGDVGFEVDMRDITGYNTTPPDDWSEGDLMTVYGTKTGEFTVRARSIR